MINQAKVVMIGYAGVGKTSIMTRFTSNSFDPYPQSTCGAAFSQKIYHHPTTKSIKFQIWDTAGQEKYKAITKIYYRDAKAAILVYDVTSKQSYDSMKSWMQELKQKGPQNIIIAIVGNKIDLLQHQITIKQVSEYSKKNNAILKFTSAKENKGIQSLFHTLAIHFENYQNICKNSTSLHKNKIKQKDNCQC